MKDRLEPIVLIAALLSDAVEPALVTVRLANASVDAHSGVPIDLIEPQNRAPRAKPPPPPTWLASPHRRYAYNIGMDGSVLIDGDARCITANMSTIGNQARINRTPTPNTQHQPHTLHPMLVRLSSLPLCPRRSHFVRPSSTWCW